MRAITRASLALFVPAALSSCRESGSPAQWPGTVDTLPSGTIRVQNPAVGLWDSTSAWQLHLDLILDFGGLHDDPVVASIEDIAVDRYGRIYLLDRVGRAVRVFDSTGQAVRTIGREGSGPGEFRDPIGIEWDDAGALWILDPGNARYTAFDTTGALVATYVRPIGGYSVPWEGGFDREGRLYDVAPVPTSEGVRLALVRLRRAGGVLGIQDTLWVLPRPEPAVFELVRGNSRTMVTVPFSAQLLWHFDPRGFVWYGLSDDYRVVQRSVEVDTALILTRDFDRVKVSDEDVERAIASLEWFTRQGGKIERQKIPAYKPAMKALTVDQTGHLWVQPVVEGEEGTIYDVFGTDGRYLGAVRADHDLDVYPPPFLLEDALLAVSPNALDEPRLVRYRIQRPRKDD